MPPHQPSRGRGQQTDAMPPNHSNTATAANPVPSQIDRQLHRTVQGSDSAMDVLAAAMSATDLEMSETRWIEDISVPDSSTMAATASDFRNSQVDDSVSASGHHAADTMISWFSHEQPIVSETDASFPQFQDELPEIMPPLPAFFGNPNDIPPELEGGIEDGALPAPDTTEFSDNYLSNAAIGTINVPIEFYPLPRSTINVPSAFWDHEWAEKMVYRLMFGLGDILQKSIEDEDPNLWNTDPGLSENKHLHPDSLRKARFYCQLMIASSFQVTRSHPEEAEAYYYCAKIAHMKTLNDVSIKLSSIAENWGMQFQSFLYKIDLLPDKFRGEACKALVDLSEKFWTDGETEKQVLDLFNGLATWVEQVWLLMIEAKEQFLRRNKRRDLLHRIVDLAPKQEELLGATHALVNYLDKDDRKCMICFDDFEVSGMVESALASQLQEDDHESNWSAEWSNEENQSSGCPSDYSEDVQPWLSVDESLCTLTIEKTFEKIPIEMPCGHIFCVGCIDTWMNKFDRAVQCPFRDHDLGKRQNWANVVKKYAFLSKRVTLNGGFVVAAAHERLDTLRNLDDRSDEERLQEHVSYVKRIGVALGPAT